MLFGKWKWPVLAGAICLLTLGMRPGVSVEESYIRTYRQLAVEEMWRSGIPASIILGQAMMESECGTSDLARRSNNHFGIKCTRDWASGTAYEFDDDRDSTGQLIQSCFRAYDSVYDSYIDHSDFLMYRKYYKELFNYSRTDYKRWANGLSEAGYATDPLYARGLIKTIEEFKLYYYDFLRPEQVEMYGYH